MNQLLRLTLICGVVVFAIGLASRLVLATAPTPAANPLSFKWQSCYPGSWCETGWYASPAVADLNHDGQPEVMWGGYSLMVVTGTNGALQWHAADNGRLWPGIVTADLDHNGSLEIVTANGSGHINVYNANGSTYPNWPVQPTGTTNELRSLAVADIDHDNNLEIIVCSTVADNEWYVYGYTGTVRAGWPQLTDSSTVGYAAGCYNENVGVADLNHAGKGEIIGPNDTHYVAAFNNDGSPVRANAIFGQVGGVNKPWALVGLNVDQAADLRGYTNCGTENRPNMALSAPTIADVNGDGTLEIVIVGNVYDCSTNPYTDLYEMPFILNADRTRWKDASNDWTVIPTPDAHAAPLSEDYNVIENSVPNPVVVDLDGDGRREILYPSYDGRMHAYWLDKTEHGSWPFQVDQHATEGFYRFATEPVVADLNNDGKAEVIFASWTQNGSNAPGKLYVVSWDGQLLQSIDLPMDPAANHGGSLAAPTIANIDADADLEVVVGTINKGLVAYDIANSAQARILWGTGRGNYQRTGLAPASYRVYLPIVLK